MGVMLNGVNVGSRDIDDGKWPIDGIALLYIDLMIINGSIHRIKMITIR